MLDDIEYGVNSFHLNVFHFHVHHARQVIENDEDEARNWIVSQIGKTHNEEHISKISY